MSRLGLLPDPGRCITSIAGLLGVSPGTLCNHIPDRRELRGRPGPATTSKIPALRRPAFAKVSAGEVDEAGRCRQTYVRADVVDVRT
ncbi:hypothetical protein ACWEJP_00800 [Streptomyces sp. NPDC004749]